MGIVPIGVSLPLFFDCELVARSRPNGCWIVKTRREAALPGRIRSSESCEGAGPENIIIRRHLFNESQIILQTAPSSDNENRGGPLSEDQGDGSDGRAKIDSDN